MSQLYGGIDLHANNSVIALSACHPVMGSHIQKVVGMLLRARREGRLPSLRRALEEVREQAGFRLDAA